jgi:hypothetical protein
VTPGIATGSDVCQLASVTTHAQTFFSFGTTQLTYTATDAGNNTTSCTSAVNVRDTQPPSIACPAPQVVECTGPAGAPVTFAATATDVCEGALTPSCPASGSTFPIGQGQASCFASDSSGNGSSCDARVTVVDTTPPTITSLTVTPNTLWPPNHKMKAVTVSATATDTCSGNAPVCQITTISSNEPINGPGDGNTAPDWQITGLLEANLRAERSGTATGRIYTLEVTCEDQQGNTTVGTTTVTVPHDQGR